MTSFAGAIIATTIALAIQAAIVIGTVGAAWRQRNDL